MEVVNLLLFVGAVWGVGAAILFLFHVRSASHQHADRLALLPLDDNWDDPQSAPATGSKERAPESA